MLRYLLRSSCSHSSAHHARPSWMLECRYLILSQFTIGRGLGNHLIIASTVVSRNHCFIEKNDDNEWVLQDTSTNGTYLNGNLIKGDKSSPLRNNDIIGFTMDQEHYTFIGSSTDFADEQMCITADTTQYDDVEEDPITEELITDPMENIVTMPPTTGNIVAQQNNGPGLKRSIIETSSNSVSALSSSDSVIIVENEDNEEIETNHGYPNKKLKTEHQYSKISQSACSTSSVVINENPSDTNEKKSETEIPMKIDPIDSTSPPKETGKHKQEEMENEMQCSICSELFVNATTLSCAHTFCRFCILRWKKNKSVCPICRCNITSLTKTLVLDNVIEKIIQNSSDDVKKRRRELIEERRKDESKDAAPLLPFPPLNLSAGFHRNLNDLQQNASVVEVSSSDNDDDDDDEYDDSPSDTEDDNWRIDYQNDEWYARVSNGRPGFGYGIAEFGNNRPGFGDGRQRSRGLPTTGNGTPGSYYGGYGNCFFCGCTGHWRNGCPLR